MKQITHTEQVNSLENVTIEPIQSAFKDTVKTLYLGQTNS